MLKFYVSWLRPWKNYSCIGHSREIKTSIKVTMFKPIFCTLGAEITSDRCSCSCKSLNLQELPKIIHSFELTKFQVQTFYRVRWCQITSYQQTVSAKFLSNAGNNRDISIFPIFIHSQNFAKFWAKNIRESCTRKSTDITPNHSSMLSASVCNAPLLE